MARAARAAPAPMAMTTRKPSWLGTVAVPSVRVIWARTTPATALETEVPMERISVLRLLAAAVSDTGTAAMISAGMAP